MEDEIYTLLKKICDEIQSINKKLDKNLDNSDITNLKHTLNTKINALFDAIELYLDKNTEIATELKRIEHKVNKLEFKIIRNTPPKTKL